VPFIDMGATASIDGVNDQSRKMYYYCETVKDRIAKRDADIIELEVYY
jgi:hypothetical protein